MMTTPDAVPAKGERALVFGYQPHPFDVICKRDRGNICHSGNIRFHLLIEMYSETYALAKTRKEKTIIIRDIINEIHACGGRFVRQSEPFVVGDVLEGAFCAFYFEIGNKKVADKVGHALRLLVSKKDPEYGRRRSWPRGTSKAKRKTSFPKPLRNDAGVNTNKKSACKSASQAIVIRASGHDAMDQLQSYRHQEWGYESTNNQLGMVFPYPVLPIAPHSWFTTGRWQSWHAGFTPLHSLDYAFVTPQSGDLSPCNASLSSLDWDLPELEGEKHVELIRDTCSFDTISLEVCQLIRSQQDRFADIPELLTQEVPLDDDDELTCDEFFLN